MARTSVWAVLLLAACAACAARAEEDAAADGPYAPPAFASELDGQPYLLETFQGDDVLESNRVVLSTNEKYARQDWYVEVPGEDGGDDAVVPGIAGDAALVLQEAAHHYGVTLPFAGGAVRPGDDGEAFVLQYEVRLTQGLDCGGAYVKVLADDAAGEWKQLHAESPYIVMFGPDKCGATNKVHLIIRHRNPVSDEWSEHHLQSPPTPAGDKNSHLYTLIIRPDNTFEVLIDGSQARAGSLLEDFDPPINPPREIDDPEDEKPIDWVDEAMIPDPEASKPDDWDEDAPKKIVDPDAEKPSDWLDDAEEYIADPTASMPEDWDEEDDGEWEAPLVPNPACAAVSGCGEWKAPVIENPEYKGKWSAPMIDNPDYVGEWEPRKIPNPTYFVDDTPAALPAMAGVAIEIWTMSAGIAFDNVLVTADEDAATDFGDATWAVKHTAEVEKAVAAKKAAEAAERLRKYEEGGIMNTINFWLVEGIEAGVANPVPSGIALLGVVGGLFWCCLKMAGGDDDPAYASHGHSHEHGHSHGDGGSDDDADLAPDANAKPRGGSARAAAAAALGKTGRDESEETKGGEADDEGDEKGEGTGEADADAEEEEAAAKPAETTVRKRKPKGKGKKRPPKTDD